MRNSAWHRINAVWVLVIINVVNIIVIITWIKQSKNDNGDYYYYEKFQCTI